jgi:hypothetical protein
MQLSKLFFEAGGLGDRDRTKLQPQKRQILASRFTVSAH